MTSKNKAARPQIVQESIIPPLPTTVRGRGLHLNGTLRLEPRLLYCSNNSVIQRNLESVNQVRINSECSVKVNVAKFSPNGEWVCAGDEAGTTNVWAHRSFVIKNTIQIGKSCLDIHWDKDGKRIVACGAGKDDKGKVFPWNTNNKLGELGGASKDFLCCDFRPCRPFRVITGSEDYGVYNYSGPPFKFQTFDKTHTNYVNSVRFRPQGDVYISCSSDKKIHVFDGKSGKKTGEIKDAANGHKGTIYEVCWSPDGERFISASADRTCKIWNYQQGAVEHTFTFADKPGVEDMQVTCLWLGDYILSVSLSGKINFLSPKSGRPTRILTGHRASCSDLCVDPQLQQVYSCDNDSRICVTSYKTGVVVDFPLAGGGNPHKGNGLKFVAISCDNRTVYSCANDDTVCLSPAVNVADAAFAVYAGTGTGDAKDDGDENKNIGDDDDSGDFTATGSVYKLPGAARFMVCGNRDPKLAVIATHNKNLVVFEQGSVKEELKLDFEPICGSLSNDDQYLAIGEAGNNNACHIYDLAAKKVMATIKNNFVRAALVQCAFSPDGKYLATTDRSRHIWLWDFQNRKFDEPINRINSFQFHVAVVNRLVWSADSLRLISAGYDGVIRCWLAPTKGESTNTALENSFCGEIAAIEYLNDDTLVGVGVDSSVRFFKIKEP